MKKSLIEVVIWNSEETTIYFEKSTLRKTYLKYVYKYCITNQMQVDKIFINSFYNGRNSRECVSVTLIPIYEYTL